MNPPQTSEAVIPRGGCASHELTEKEALLWDGTTIFYRAWIPKAPTDKAILLFHRGHEHSGRFGELVERLNLPDFAVFAWDARGHGRSPGERGWAPGFGAMVRDLDSFVRWVAQNHGIPVENMAILAHSVAGVTAAAWVHDYAPPIRALILATPAFRVKLYVPFAIPGLRLLLRIKGKAFVKSYVRPGMLTHDPEWARRYAEDPLISRNIAVNILLGLHDAATRVLADAGAIHVPTLLLSAGSDWVVRNDVQEVFFERLSSPVKQREHYAGFFHSIYHEKERERPIERTRTFILDTFRHPVQKPDMTGADQSGHSKDLYDRIARPMLRGSLRRAGYACARFSMKTLGCLSAGIRLGWRKGFDSGAMLDYVYRNHAEGAGRLGRWIDQLYLDSPGWTGIRHRRENIKAFLDGAIAALRRRNSPIRILDIAAGHGRYVLEAVQRAGGNDVSVHLRDFEEANVNAASQLARELGVRDVVCQQGDAFDHTTLAAIRPRPNIVLVSGLFELFPKNGPVRASLTGIAADIEDEGFLIYTNQPWHPQHEFIARVLDNREGKPWVMRCRSQVEMDQLVEKAGFRKTGMLIDEDGIFTVSIAQKNRGA